MVFYNKIKLSFQKVTAVFLVLPSSWQVSYNHDLLLPLMLSFKLKQLLLYLHSAALQMLQMGVGKKGLITAMFNKGTSE